MTTKNPKFFKIIQIIALALGASSAVVVWLQGQGIVLPSWLSSIGDMQIMVNTLITLILAQLPNQDKIV